MLDAYIIVHVKESDWIISTVIEDKNTGVIRICIDMRKLNDARLHDPFPTPFTYEVLERVWRTGILLIYEWIFNLSPNKDMDD